MDRLSSSVSSAADTLVAWPISALMVVVFQFDLAILFGQLGSAVFTPYTVICLIPAFAGVVGDRYLSKCKYDLQIGSRYFLIGNIANALLVITVFWLGGVLLAFQSRGRFMPLSFLTGIFVLPVSSSRRWASFWFRWWPIGSDYTGKSNRHPADRPAFFLSAPSSSG